MTGAELKALRLELALTQDELARKIGLTQGRIAQLEAGDAIGAQTELLLGILTGGTLPDPPPMILPGGRRGPEA